MSAFSERLTLMLCRLGIGSVTHAITAEQRLKNSGVAAKLIKLDAASTKKGCSYGLEVDCDSIRKATSVLRRNGIFYNEIKK
jgi:hypothetical protein